MPVLSVLQVLFSFLSFTQLSLWHHKVLKGARKTILKLRPVVIFEVGDYLMKEEDIDFTFYLDYFENCYYSLFDTKSGRKVTRQNYRSCIPLYSAIDVIALPSHPANNAS
jgi:hypothetical protein